MEALVIVLVVVLVLVGTIGGLVATRRRQPDLEPPVDRATLPPSQAPASPEAVGEAEADERQTAEAPAGLEPEVDAEAVIREAEEVLREAAPPPSEPVPAPAPEPVVAAPPRFRDRLGKARSLVSGYLGSVLSRSQIDDDTWDELEEALIRADVGVSTTTSLLEGLKARVRSEGITAPDALLEALKADLKKGLASADRELRIQRGGPNVWLFVGVNGVGKTTTIGKVGARQRALGRPVVMAAGDTFRAAAVEQLELWAERSGADLVRGAEGSDPGAVVFDAVQRAAARDVELVLADTAGRLHTKVNLMEELKKVRRVAERPPGRVSEVLLVLDATTGQNGLVQARQFTEAVEVTGVVLTKLDGTAKGGIALAVQTELGIPIKLVGLGEKAEDLVDFDPDEFVEAVFS